MKNLLILFFFIPCRLFAQDLAGVWTGTLYNDSTGTTTQYEIAVADKNGKWNAYSYAVFQVDNKEVYGVKSIEVIQSKGKLFFRDRDLLVDNYPPDAPKGVKQISSVRLFDSSGAQYIAGTFTTTRSGKYGRPVTGKILLVKRKDNLRDVTVMKQIIKQNLAPALDFITGEDAFAQNKTTPNNTIPKEDAVIAKPEANNSAIRSDAAFNDPQKTKESNASVRDLPAKKTVTQQPVEIKNPAQLKDDRINETASANNNIVRSQSEASKPAPQQKRPNTKVENAGEHIVKAEQSPVIKKPEAVKSDALVASANTASKSTAEKTAANIEEKPAFIPNNQKPVSELPKNISIPKITTVSEQLALREIQNIQTVEFVSDSLRLELYDNGTIDGDSVSVIVNGRVVMEHQLLSGRAIPKTVYAEGDTLKVVMFAENLGSIAPNTGLLIVYDGQKRYEISFSGDLRKNSAILFKRRK